MTYSISVVGHTDEKEKSREIFKRAARELKEISPASFSATFTDNEVTLNNKDIDSNAELESGD